MFKLLDVLRSGLDPEQYESGFTVGSRDFSQCEDAINNAWGCPAIRSPGSIGHNRICMTTMAGPSTPKVPDRPTTLFSNADLCRILEVSFPVPLRGGSPSSTKLSAAIVHRSGSAR